MRKRIDLEYIFSSSVTILFSRLSSAPGLAEWFSDDVKHDGNIFTFVWDGIGGVSGYEEKFLRALQVAGCGR